MTLRNRQNFAACQQAVLPFPAMLHLYFISPVQHKVRTFTRQLPGYYCHLSCMQLPAKVRIKENSFAAKAAAWKLRSEKVALVLGDTIHLYNVSENDFLLDKKWVTHELKHIEQFRRYGTFRFLCLYLVEWMRHGYYNNKFEIEAREAEII